MSTSEYLKSLLRATCQHTGIAPERITGRNRTQPLCEARWAIWIVLREQGLTFQEIGDHFRRNHGTVLKGIQSAERHQGTRESSFRALIAAVRNHQSTNETTITTSSWPI